ncbi:MAG: hypothetical protein J6Y43_07030, partial [Clostridia bacterium]|nr:hypothetical protein [Clostridia bacterium]
MEKTIKNRLLAGLIAVATVFSLAFGLSLTSQVKTARADYDALQNVQQDGSVLTWDAFGGAVYYNFEIYSVDGSGNGETRLEEPTVDLEYWAKNFQLESGDCQYIIYAEDENYERLSEDYINVYNFTNTQIPLDNPTVWWDHSTACWTSVDGVDEYYSYGIVYYKYVDGENDVCLNYYIQWVYSGKTYHAADGLEEGETYYFEVQAQAGDLEHKDSEYVRSDLKTMTAEDLEYVYVEKEFTLYPEDIEVALGENPEPTWAVNFDAVKYEVYKVQGASYHLEYIGVDGYAAETELSCIIPAQSEEKTITYEVRMYYTDTEYIAETFACTWVEEIVPTTLTGTVVIDGGEIVIIDNEEYIQVKYDTPITINLIDSNNTGNLKYRVFEYVFGSWYYIEDMDENTFCLPDVGYHYFIAVFSDVETDFLASREIIIIQADGPAAPTGITATNCTTSDNNDGTISGVTTKMEYKLETAEEWT